MSAIEKSFVMKHVFKGIASMEFEEVKFADQENHFGLTWTLGFEKQDYTHYLTLMCDTGEERIENFSATVECEICAESGGKSIVIFRKQHTYDNCELGCGFAVSIGEQVVDDSVTLEFRVKILEVRGVEGMKSRYDAAMSEFSDVVVVVQGEKFHVSKLYLASRSAYFESLFMGTFKESNQSEVVLDGIEVDDFQNFLDILYNEITVNDENVNSLLHVADMYAAKCVMKQVEKFLLEDSKKSTKEKLELAAKYHFEDLKNKYLSEIKTVADIRAVLPEDLNEMDSGLVLELFKKSLARH